MKKYDINTRAPARNPVQKIEMSNFIQWPVAKYWEKTWNPMIGCHPCSPACKHCVEDHLHYLYELNK